ncbi:response regulator transcription factor [Coraliomargarita algicola]|uniref:Response regulator transcription factor n=1 Tax=Coraliomargarita algicola TaxID=3092156 RepID=A0ABZ0RJ58_9BACT|nr:response regulator transcription factor [Coraliomargarita sp. J2-16]WPJ96236.1 response regulator transcription factor [Coraliomargarita sp. J2-16]
MNRVIKITLIEDHPEFREVVGLALASEADLELIGTYGSAERALRILENPKNEAKPDIILLDLNLPGISGLEAIPWLKEYVPNSKIIVLSQSDKESEVVSAIQLGATGYLLKSSQIDQLIASIRSVADGGSTLDPQIAKYILKHLQDKQPNLKVAKPLSDRELEILHMLSEGLLKKEIAEKLGISINTVARHIVHTYEKLEVQNAPAAINKAYKAGIFPK